MKLLGCFYDGDYPGYIKLYLRVGDLSDAISEAMSYTLSEWGYVVLLPPNRVTVRIQIIQFPAFVKNFRDLIDWYDLNYAVSFAMNELTNCQERIEMDKQALTRFLDKADLLIEGEGG